ncbi:ER lumen protein retaining receptor-domain-containing protein [Podospora fimiseda]|uniref:ER lumen protein retaining receptor-domain-containing protein n=1 Tax=Podospora fimiseda TaxID=252190 RepID=A0AAN7H249_9PEZI|nr:ER lumen protein retaining receptor-domain-containing protein [Podospora fimiseda]
MLLADLSHITAKCILLFSIHKNRSSEGVSLLTQILYALVFITRYTDLFDEQSSWNVFFKVFYLLSSFYTISIMRFVFPRTREREKAWKMGAAILVGSLILSPFVMLIFEKKGVWGFAEMLWVFSQILESVCVLPQLLLLRQTTVPTVITSFYIVFLGAYRGLYLINWIIRELDANDRKPNPVSVLFGIIQTALYVDFAWVYWTRQRVKLRNGGVVDADDLGRGWLLSKIFGHRNFNSANDPDGDGLDEESAPALGRGGGYNDHDINGGRNSRVSRAKWGARGISISADDDTLEAENGRSNQLGDDDQEHGVIDPDAKMQDPDDLARALQDEEDDVFDSGESKPLRGKQKQQDSKAAGPSGVGNGDEWNDD